MTGNVLIVGGLGYVGSRLAVKLGTTHKVWVTGRTLSAERENWLARHASIISFSPYDPAKAAIALPDIPFDVAINLGMPSASQAASDEGTARTQAIRTVSECVRLLESRRIARLIHFSTFHVYGRRGQSTYDETDVPEPLSAYGRIHLACEKFLLGNSGDFDTTILRPTNIVGAPGHADIRAQLNLLFLDLCRQAVYEHRICLNTNGLGFRDFVPMPDAISAVECVMRARADSRVMNLSSGTAVQLRSLSEQIATYAGVKPEFGSGTDPFTSPFTVTNSRLREIGWTTLPDALSTEIVETLSFFRAARA